MTSIRIWLVVFLFASVAYGQETTFEGGIGFTSPYVFDPHNGIGDTTLNLGFDIHVVKKFYLHQSLNYGLVGAHFFRYEMGPEFRFLLGTISPFLNVGPVFQITPFNNLGMYSHFGVVGDLSRLSNIYFLKVKIESGLDFFLTNINRNEWEIFRISLVYGF